MKLAGWVDKFTYSNKEYWHPLVDKDPFLKYSYNSGVIERNTSRRKIKIIEDIKNNLKIPKNVLKDVNKKMGIVP